MGSGLDAARLICRYASHTDPAHDAKLRIYNVLCFPSCSYLTTGSSGLADNEYHRTGISDDISTTRRTVRPFPLFRYDFPTQISEGRMTTQSTGVAGGPLSQFQVQSPPPGDCERSKDSSVRDRNPEHRRLRLRLLWLFTPRQSLLGNPATATKPSLLCTAARYRHSRSHRSHPNLKSKPCVPGISGCDSDTTARISC